MYRAAFVLTYRAVSVLTYRAASILTYRVCVYLCVYVCGSLAILCVGLDAGVCPDVLCRVYLDVGVCYEGKSGRAINVLRPHSLSGSLLSSALLS